MAARSGTLEPRDTRATSAARFPRPPAFLFLERPLQIFLSAGTSVCPRAFPCCDARRPRHTLIHTHTIILSIIIILITFQAPRRRSSPRGSNDSLASLTPDPVPQGEPNRRRSSGSPNGQMDIFISRTVVKKNNNDDDACCSSIGVPSNIASDPVPQFNPCISTVTQSGINELKKPNMGHGSIRRSLIVNPTLSLGETLNSLGCNAHTTHDTPPVRPSLAREDPYSFKTLFKF